jgi:hypothetical protein
MHGPAPGHERHQSEPPRLALEIHSTGGETTASEPQPQQTTRKCVRRDWFQDSPVVSRTRGRLWRSRERYLWLLSLVLTVCLCNVQCIVRHASVAT